MTPLRTSLLLCTLLAACGDKPVLQDAGGRYRVMARIPIGDAATAKAALAAHVARHGAPAVVFADGTVGESVLATAGGAAWVVVGSPAADAKNEPAVVVRDETGAVAAMDMALLSCAGIAPPQRLPIGSRVFTTANRATGGMSRPAPGDFVLEMLRRQHAVVLAEKPNTDVVFRMGLVVSRATDEWHARVRDELVAAKQRRPQIDIEAKDAGGDAAREEALVRTFLAAGHRAIFVSSDDPDRLIAAVVAEANERKVALVVLDPLQRGEAATCTIGTDQNMLGRAAGEAIARLLPNGGTLVELYGDQRGMLHQRRHQGFVESLGLR